MIVKELIDILEQFDTNAPVMLISEDEKAFDIQVKKAELETGSIKWDCIAICSAERGNVGYLNKFES